MTPEQLAAARHHLDVREPRLAPHVPQHLAPRYSDGDYYQVLCHALVNQQLSSKAAATIAARIMALAPGDGFPAPSVMAGLDPGALRAAGLSGQKTRYIQALAERVASGALDIEALDALDDDEVVTAVTTVPGIGQWTAEMLLIFGMGRPDVMPWGDLAIREGIKRLHRLPERPGGPEVLALTDHWRPWRSAGALALWRSLDATPAV